MAIASAQTLTVLLVVLAGYWGDEPADAPSKKSSDAGPIVSKATVKVEKGRLTASVTAKGTIEGESRTEIKVRLKSWGGPLVVEQAAEHGTHVKPGDVLVKFEDEKLERLVRETREDRESSALALHLAELELPLEKRQLPLDLQAAERAKQQTGEDLQRFLQAGKGLDIASAQFSLRSAEFNVEYARNELEQLEKMYRDKDLTEETEEMILKRYKFMLASAEQSLEHAKYQTEQILNVVIPRREEAFKLGAAKAELAWEKARDELPARVKQKEFALEKLRHDERRAKEKLAELEHDLKQLTVTAPAEGIVYYGRYHEGQWSGPPSASYLKGGTLPSGEVFMTIMSRGKLYLHANVEEKEIGEIKVGQAARLTPTISPQRKLNGKVHRVVPIPQGGKYAVVVALTDDAPEMLAPGMTASARIVTQEREATLFVPSTAVFEDAEQETSYVYLAGGDKPEKKTVKVGIAANGKTEIVEGLKEGDEILATKP
jgi:multidrug resistance efflux pump